MSGGWCDGDFNADGVTDGQDFIAWNSNKFTSSDLAVNVPKPTATTATDVSHIDRIFKETGREAGPLELPPV